MPYPMIEDVLQLARVHLNDTQAGATSTPGEGRIFIDSASFIIPLLNESIAQLQRRLETSGVPTTHKEFFSPLNTPVPPINGPLGVGQPDPSVQQYLSFGGIFDGLSLNTTLKLPADFLMPIRLWQRTNGSGTSYTEIFPAQGGLASRNQDLGLGDWDWRGDSIAWNGGTVTKDIRLRYVAAVAYFASNLNPNQFATTPIPFLDSGGALAYLMAFTFSSAQSGSEGAKDLNAGYERAVVEIINRHTRGLQRTRYHRPAYGSDGDFAGDIR